MYKIRFFHMNSSSGNLLYEPGNDDLSLVSAELSLEEGKAGELTISIPNDNTAKDSIVCLTDEIVVYRDDEELFRGRCVTRQLDFDLTGVLTCEGVLAYLYDTYYPPFEFSGSPNDLLTKVITNHNSYVSSGKKFTLGTITVKDSNDYIARSSEAYNRTLDILSDKFVGDSLGGYFRVRTVGTTKYLDYLSTYNTTATQTIELGKNILDIAQEVEYGDLITAILPLGEKTTDTSDDGTTTSSYVTVSSVNSGDIYVRDTTLINKYGFICECVEWSDVTEPKRLLTKAIAHLAQKGTTVETITVNAVDLYLVGEEKAFQLGDLVKIKSDPHGINQTLELSSMKLNLLNPANDQLTFGATGTSLTSKSSSSNRNITESVNNVAAIVGRISADYISVHNLSAEVAKLNYATIDELEAAEAKINTALISKADIADLNAAKAEINTLDAGYANINSLLAGNVSTGSSQTIVLNANNTTIENALIKDAMIDSLSFNKITGMDINTTKLTVHSDNGNSTWTDNTIQISDGKTVRVQIGEDDAGDYNLYLWDASGNMLWNATGVTSAGLNDGIIKDAAVASDANIAGSKLDIDSVMVAMNGSTTTISSSKVKIDSTGQTLEVAFNEAAYAMNNLYSTTETHSTQIKAAQGEIEALLISSDDRLTDCNWLKTKYTDLSATVDGISSTVSSHTTTLNKQATQIETVESNITSLNTSVNGIEASVSSIQADYTGLEGRVTTNESSIKANADNIALKVSESDVTGNYLVSKINLDSTTATIAAKHINLVGSVTVSDFASATKSGLMTDAMIYYALSDSSTTAPTDGWNKTAPDWKSGKYMWQKTVTVYLDGSTEESVTCISGAKGDTGASGSSGVGVKSITNYYLAYTSASGVTTSTSGWTTTIQTISTSKRYLWNYEVVTYTNGNTEKTDPHVIGVYGDTGATGATGATGKGISLVNEYYAVSTSNTTAPTSWSLTVPTMTATNKYLWSYEMITYTDDTTSDTEKRVIGVYGDKGATGATGATGAAGADAIVVTVTASNGIVFKNNSGSTILTAHVYKGNVEQSITDAGVCGSLGSIKWYKGSTAVATSKTLTVSASDVANSQAYTCQLEG